MRDGRSARPSRTGPLLLSGRRISRRQAPRRTDHARRHLRHADRVAADRHPARQRRRRRKDRLLRAVHLLARLYGRAAVLRQHPEFREDGVYITDVLRNDQHLPAGGETVLQRGDVLTLVGARGGLNKLVAKIGAVVKNDSTDFVYIGFGIVAGSLLGQIVVKLGDIPMSLGTGGGCLISGLVFGLVFGWFRARKQTFGAFPPQAATTLKDMGLAVFIACTGLAAGPQAWPLLKEYGVLLPFAGIAMVLVPATISLVVGRKLLKIEKPLLIGAIAGQQCSTPAITSITQVAQSSVLTLHGSGHHHAQDQAQPGRDPVLRPALALRAEGQVHPDRDGGAERQARPEGEDDAGDAQRGPGQTELDRDRPP